VRFVDDSIWDNVRFNHDAAGKAVRALQFAAAQLGEAISVRTEQANHARQDWWGATRDEFEQTLEPALREAADLRDALGRAAGTIQEAMELATTEQKERVKARARYQADIHQP
jgi:hypothetical protein